MKKLLLTSAFMAAAISASASSAVMDTDAHASPTGGSIPALPSHIAQASLELQSFCRMPMVHSATVLVRMGGESLSRLSVHDTVQWESLTNPHKAVTIFQDHENLTLNLSPALILGTFQRVNLIRESICMAIDLLRTSCTGVRPANAEQAQLYPTLPCTTHTEKMGGPIFHPTNIHIHLPYIPNLPEAFKDEIKSYGLSVDASNGGHVILKGNATRVRQHRYFVWIKGAPDWEIRDANYLRYHLGECLHGSLNKFRMSDAWTYFEMRIPHSNKDLEAAAIHNEFRIVTGPHLPVLPWNIYRRTRAGL